LSLGRKVDYPSWDMFKWHATTFFAAREGLFPLVNLRWTTYGTMWDWLDRN
jgi:hypothetical protein